MRLLFSLLIFMIWASLMRYGYVCVIKEHCNLTSEPIEIFRPKTLDLSLNDTITYLKNFEQFAFSKDSVHPTLSDQNQLFLDSLSSIIKQDSTVLLTLTGLYRPSEAAVDVDEFSNIGAARANAVIQLLQQDGVPENQTTITSKAGDGEKLLQPLIFELNTVFDTTSTSINQ